MTAPALTATRADLIERAIQHHDQAHALATDLATAGYTDPTLLSVHRSQYRLSARWSLEVGAVLAGLGDDPEGRE